jgi:hypothetical protein
MKRLAIIAVLLCGCHSAPKPSTVANDINQAVTRGMMQPIPVAYRVKTLDTAHNTGWYYYWKQIHPTIVSGICAAMYGGNNGGQWEVDLPLQQRYTIVNTRQQAETMAETACPSISPDWRTE